MNYNAIISVEDITDESGVYEEPLSMEEVKNYLRLEGYTDVDESTADELSDFDFDDNLLSDLIPGARGMLEKATGVSFIPKTYEVILTNLCGMIELPYGPVGTIVSVKDKDDNVLTTDEYTLVGNTWKFLKEPLYENMTITYEGGYTELPKAMKVDLLRLVAYMYENRGDDPAIQNYVSQLAFKYARPSL